MNDRFKNSELTSDTTIQNIPTKKIKDLKKVFLGFLSFVKISIVASVPNTIIYICLTHILKISIKLLIAESSEQVKIGKK